MKIINSLQQKIIEAFQEQEMVIMETENELGIIRFPFVIDDLYVGDTYFILYVKDAEIILKCSNYEYDTDERCYVLKNSKNQIFIYF